jgi:hypothetical protein
MFPPMRPSPDDRPISQAVRARTRTRTRARAIIHVHEHVSCVDPAVIGYKIGGPRRMRPGVTWRAVRMRRVAALTDHLQIRIVET